MSEVNFATTNVEKIRIAQTVSAENGITIVPVSLEIDEIQGENPEPIVRDKARRAFELIGKPVVVSDDSWDIRALKGFPGAYMKSINHWFEPEDFLRLMHGVDDRHIALHQFLAYDNGKTTNVFQNTLEGQIINEVRGKHAKSPNMTLIALDSDNGRTIAEVFEQGEEVLAERYRTRQDVWHKFVEWFVQL